MLECVLQDQSASQFTLFCVTSKMENFGGQIRLRHCDVSASECAYGLLSPIAGCAIRRHMWNIWSNQISFEGVSRSATCAVVGDKITIFL
eukprot:scaffold6755_cov72-Cylindrotheca_fusiformis.AAC.1